MIRLQCVCGRKIAAPDQWLGKRVKCPQCGQPVTVRQPTVAAASPGAASPEPAIASTAAPRSVSSRPRTSNAVGVERSAPPRLQAASPAQADQEPPIHAHVEAATTTQEPAVKINEPPPRHEIEFSPPTSSPFDANPFAEDAHESQTAFAGPSPRGESEFAFDPPDTEPASPETDDREDSTPVGEVSGEPTASTETDDTGGFTSEDDSEHNSGPEPDFASTSVPGLEDVAVPVTEVESVPAPESDSSPAAQAPPVSAAPGPRRRIQPIPVDPKKLKGDEDDFETRRARLPFWLGVLGILVGLAGGAALWLPQYALYAIPVAGLGVALGAIGVAVSMSRYRIGLAAPSIATIISLAALVLPFVLPSLYKTATVPGRFSTLQKEADEQRAAQEARRRAVMGVNLLQIVSPDADTQTPEIKYVLVNNSGKTIRTFNGSIQLYDQDHQPLGGLQLEKDGPFAPGVLIKGQNVWTLDPQVQKMIVDHKTTADYRADSVRFDDGGLETFGQ